MIAATVILVVGSIYAVKEIIVNVY